MPDEVQDDVPARPGPQVEHHGPLAPVERPVEQGSLPGVQAPLPQFVARAGPLHLDDVGAEVREQPPRGGCRDVVAEFHDPQAGQREFPPVVGHAHSPQTSTVSSPALTRLPAATTTIVHPTTRRPNAPTTMTADGRLTAGRAMSSAPTTAGPNPAVASPWVSGTSPAVG